MSEGGEAFLDRWSRLKREQVNEEEEAAVPQKAEREPEAAEQAPLPPVEDLKPDSDFTPFMAAKVDPGTRSAALKKLFADAHYNVPDPFEAYSEDYTVEDPIPAEMLKTLNHARKLLFEEPEKIAQAPMEADAETPTEGAGDVAGKQDT